MAKSKPSQYCLPDQSSLSRGFLYIFFLRMQSYFIKFFGIYQNIRFGFSGSAFTFYLFTFSTMFQWCIISRSNINGKLHTFQKDFDDYDDYQKFVGDHPEYDSVRLFQNFWNPWSLYDNTLLSAKGSTLSSLPVDTRHLPEGISLDKYGQRRTEKKQSEASWEDCEKTISRTYWGISEGLYRGESWW